MSETPELVERLRGRAAFCRDRSEIKTPELLEAAADAITALQEKVRRLEDALYFYKDAWVDANRRQQARGWDVVPSLELKADAGDKARTALNGSPDQ